MTLLSKWDNADTPNKAYSLWLHSDDTLISRYEDGTPGETQTKSDSAFVVAGDVGNWVHIAVTADVSAATIVMYKNGSVISSTNADSRSTSITNGNAEFRIGSRNDAGAALDTLDGLIDEVRVWNDIRTPTEIADNKDKELIGTEANLQGYWKFNNDYTDETSNGNDLTASGSPVFSTDIPFGGIIDQAITATMQANPQLANPMTLLLILTSGAEASTSIVKSAVKAITATTQAQASFTKQVYKELITTMQANPQLLSGQIFVQAITATAEAVTSITRISINIIVMTATAQASTAISKVMKWARTLTGTAEASNSISQARYVSRVLEATAKAVNSISKGISTSVTMNAYAGAQTAIEKLQQLSKSLVATSKAATSIIRDWEYLDKYPENDQDYEDKYPNI